MRDKSGESMGLYNGVRIEEIEELGRIVTREQLQQGLVVRPTEPAVLLERQKLNGSRRVVVTVALQLLDRAVLRMTIDEYRVEAEQFFGFCKQGIETTLGQVGRAIIDNNGGNG